MKEGCHAESGEVRLRGTRALHPVNPRLEALLAQRDDLRVQISLLLDAKRPDYGQIRSLEQELAAIERQIPKNPRW